MNDDWKTWFIIVKGKKMNEKKMRWKKEKGEWKETFCKLYSLFVPVPTNARIFDLKSSSIIPTPPVIFRSNRLANGSAQYTINPSFVPKARTSWSWLSDTQFIVTFLFTVAIRKRKRFFFCQRKNFKQKKKIGSCMYIGFISYGIATK